MAFSMRNRSLIKEMALNSDELRFLLTLRADLKAAKYSGFEPWVAEKATGV